MLIYLRLIWWTLLAMAIVHGYAVGGQPELYDLALALLCASAHEELDR